VREEIERFFRSYCDAYNNGDPVAIARHIAVPSLMLERTAITPDTICGELGAFGGSSFASPIRSRRYDSRVDGRQALRHSPAPQTFLGGNNDQAEDAAPYDFGGGPGSGGRALCGAGADG
jgi:hypothetical protein